MSWSRDDDDMLDHEKWRRAIREGGADALLIWFRLRAWCSRRLTDGEIPADMVTEVGEVIGKTRLRALRALVDAALLARRDDGGFTIVDYLQRNPSRAQVLQERDRRAEAQRKRRSSRDVTGHAVTSEPPRNEVPSRPVPSRPVSLSNESEDTRAPDVPDVPGLEIVHPGPLQPSKRERRLDAQALALNRLMHKYPGDFDPTKANQARGHELGLSDEEIWQRWFECKDKPYPHGFDDPEAQFNRELAWAKSDKEKRSFKTKSERDAFEMPGRERRAT